MEPNKSVDVLATDPLLAPFFDEAFNPEAYVRSIIRQDAGSSSSAGIQAGTDETAAESALAAVRQRSSDVEHAIRHLLSGHIDSLVEQAAETKELQARIVEVSGKARSMQTVANRVRTDVLAPFAQLEAHTATLKRMSQAMDVLKRTKKLHLAIRKLRSMLTSRASTAGTVGSSSESVDAAAQSPNASAANPAPGPAAAAAAPDLTVLSDPQNQARILSRVSPLLREIEDALRDPSIAGVLLIDAERPFVASVVEEARKSARQLLHKAGESLNAADVAVALASLHDLGCMAEEVTAALDRICDTAGAQARDCLDVRSVAAAANASIEGASPSSTVTAGTRAPASSSAAGGAMPGLPTRSTGPLQPPPGAAAAWRGAFWGKCEGLSEALQRSCLQAWNIVHVICRRKDGAGASSAHAAASLSGGSSFSGSKPSSIHPLLADIAAAFATGRIAPHPSESTASGVGSEGVDPDVSVYGPLATTMAAASLAASNGAVDQHAYHPGVRLLRRFFVSLSVQLLQELFAVTTGDGHAFVRSVLVDSYPRFHYTLLEVIPRTGRSVALRTADDDRDSYHAGIGGVLSGGAFGGGYRDPRLAGILGSIGSSSSSSSASARFSSAPLSGSQIFAAACDGRRLLRAATPLLRLYLARSLSRMTDALHGMFPPAHSKSRKTQHQQQQQPGSTASARLAASGGAAAGINANGFTVSADMDRLMDEPALEPPSLQSTQAFARAITTELNACKPSGFGAASAGASAAAAALSSPLRLGLGSGGSASASSASGSQIDPLLYAAVSKGVATAIKLLVAQAEGATVVGPAAVGVAEHWMPTPSQIANHGLACRLDEVRLAIVRCLFDLPLPHPFDRLSSLSAHDPGLKAAAAARSSLHPLALPLPPHLLAVTMGLQRSGQQASGGASPVAGTAQGIVLRSLEHLDRCIEAILFPWFQAAARPLERAVMRLHDQTVPSGPLPSAIGMLASAASTAAAAAGTSTSAATVPPSNGSALPPMPPADSEWVTSLESYCAGLASHQLPLLPQGYVSDQIRSGLAARLLSMFARHACIVRGSAVDDSVRMRLARDCAQLEISVSPLWQDMQRLGSSYSALRALRPVLFASTAEIAAAAVNTGAGSSTATKEDAGSGMATTDTQASQNRDRLRSSLVSLRPCDLLHLIAARLPREFAMPHVKSKLTAGQYSEWMDAVAAKVVAAGSSGAAAAGGDSQLQQELSDPVLLMRASLYPSSSALVAIDTAASTRLQPSIDEFWSRIGTSAALQATSSSGAIPSSSTTSQQPQQIIGSLFPEYVLLQDRSSMLAQLQRA